MKVAFCLLALLVVSATAYQQCGKKGPSSRIINGVNAGSGEFPWQVSLRTKYGGHICGGTLISPQWILCAAHCFGQSRNPSSYVIRVGEWKQRSRDGTERDYSVSRVILHSQYNYPKQFSNDIALLKLSSSVDISGPYAGLACLPAPGEDYRGTQNCLLSGWGLVRRYPATPANQLQKVSGRIWGASEMRQQYYSLPDGVVGFGEPRQGWSACMGDSGGPLVCPNKEGTYDVIGVVSFGPSTCSGKPGVFTEVAAFRRWIRSMSGL